MRPVDLAAQSWSDTRLVSCIRSGARLHGPLPRATLTHDASLNNSNTLFSTELAGVKDYSRRFAKQMDKTTEIGQSFLLPCSSLSVRCPFLGLSPDSVIDLVTDIIKAELEEKQFKVKLNVIDTPGFGDYVNNRDSWNPIVDFIVRFLLVSS